MSALRSERIETWAVRMAYGQPGLEVFSAFLSFLAKGSRKNKCQHLCQMGARWNFCAAQVMQELRCRARAGYEAGCLKNTIWKLGPLTKIFLSS